MRIFRWPLFGLKLSLCFSIISVWGIIQFVLLGGFFMNESGQLINELEFDEDINDDKAFAARLTEAYNQRAYNCWLAAIFYIGLLIFAGSQFLVNKKASTMSSNMVPPFPDLSEEQNARN